MKLRKLNGQGVEIFRTYVNDLREGHEQNYPLYLLDSNEFSQKIAIDVAIGNEKFDSRYQMGVYLVDLLKNQNMTPYIGDIGLWSWLALYWFDQLCPVKAGKLIPNMDYNYVYSPGWGKRHRHAVYMTWQLVNRYGPDCAFMLCKTMSSRGEITEQMMARQENLSSRGVMELGNNLYFDENTGLFKRGAAARKSPGCIARYITWLDQIKMTYDIYSISADDLESLLPDEFVRFQ